MSAVSNKPVRSSSGSSTLFSRPDLSLVEIVPPRYVGRWIMGVLVLGLLVLIVRAFANAQIEWNVVAKYLAAPTILAGFWHTMILSVLAMIVGVALGLAISIMRMSDNPLLVIVAFGYQWFFRGTPVILQLLIWYNLALIIPVIGIPGLWTAPTVDVITPFWAALLGLGINQGAYTSEVIRAGILSVDAGQHEAAQSIGMTRLHALWRIVLPQAMRVIVPPIGNEFIGMVKMTSLASVIQYTDLLYSAQNVYFVNQRVIELLIVAGAWYLLAVSILTPLQLLLEWRFARGTSVVRVR
ncbi:MULTISPECIES: amino acid ABC transporter permease [Bradyrhizobium]|uniref:Glutamate/aspartate import permease protein GltK n=3 Tax=Bradyrhizobium TaxID=374 RepID=A0AAE5X906_9BRAD|nr:MULTISPECIES: amino acid ABC transporter permease [Bradyrhizobium]MCG2628028.1 amino acid ABC transporter permease [Bradyrhizobium zhengyangense]MCG2643147.1 amino acid ABC transporter permease [Bradyrhizobium zhengyangense]MCG2670539.1 amino acid ABC transporter permease [Bradyrhizobium zhengyangense]MDN4985726.1 amino acid ABC transporter permease [Bradyrhizobium sp. WYCCWR 13022]MDT4736567.1 amino acid ABC transporter permease [Bradyrhizobium sp. WYCCWR 12699]